MFEEFDILFILYRLLKKCLLRKNSKIYSERLIIKDETGQMFNKIETCFVNLNGGTCSNIVEWYALARRRNGTHSKANDSETEIKTTNGN